MFKKFEELHPSQTAAFVDGLLCGVVITIMVGGFVKQIREDRAKAKLWKEFELND